MKCIQIVKKNFNPYFLRKSQHYIHIIQKPILNERRSSYSNRQIAELYLQALNSLKNRRDIVIKEADKGGDVVV